MKPKISAKFDRCRTRSTGDIHNSTVEGLFMTPIDNESDSNASRLSAHVYNTSAYLNFQLHNFDLFRTCRTSSFCTVTWQLARFQLTWRIARSLVDSWASCSRNDKEEQEFNVKVSTGSIAAVVCCLTACTGQVSTAILAITVAVK